MAPDAAAVRTLVVWCDDWPIVAAGVDLDVPAAALHANRVVACSPAARSEGVAVGHRRREAQARCPEMVLFDHDPAVDARAFEPVAGTLQAITPRIEVTEPGTCSFPTRGPARYHGGEGPLAVRTLDLVGSVLADRGPVRVGVADGQFAARLAARAARLPGEPAIVPTGGSAEFLATRNIAALGTSELVGVLQRLGLRTLGDLAAIPAPDILGRFGTPGLVAHRLASGLDEQPPATRPPPDDLSVDAQIDPPAERLEAAAFIARGLADELHARLTTAGSACTRLLIGAETEHGERHERVWRTEGGFTAATIAERTRWQIDGWLTAGANRPTGGLTRLWLAPDEIVPAGGRQLTMPSGSPNAIDAVDAADRAARALARVGALIGTDHVHVVEYRGGRGPGEQIRLVPAAAVDVTEPRPAAQDGWVTEPWPGQVPTPNPAIVHDPPSPARLLDATGQPVTVNGRGEISTPPATLHPTGAQPVGVASWAGPWPYDERWWDPETHRRCARLQLITTTGNAYLVTVEHGDWTIEATYD